MQRLLGRERGASPGGSAAGFVELTELRVIQKLGLGGTSVGGEGRGEGLPLPVGEVLSAGDKALKAMEILRGVLGEEVVASVENLVQGNLPPKVPTPSPPSPTEEERMERHAALLRKQRAVEKKVGEGRSRVEKAKAKVAEEEGRLAEVEAELAGVVEQIRVFGKRMRGERET